MLTMQKRAAHSARPDDQPDVFEVGQLLSARIDTKKLADALNRFYYATRPRPSKTGIVLAAVEDFLAKLGHMDAPPESHR
jgi:hypothetical protein